MSLLNHDASPERVAQFNDIAKKVAFQIADDLADGDTIKPLEALEVVFVCLLYMSDVVSDIQGVKPNLLQDVILGTLMMVWNRDPMQFAIDIRKRHEVVKTMLRDRLDPKNRN